MIDVLMKRKINIIKFDQQITTNYKIILNYIIETNQNTTKAYTLGIRDNSKGNIGFNSCAIGKDVVASAYLSYAEGYKTIAEGIYSHAEGRETYVQGPDYSLGPTFSNTINANGEVAHVEGYLSKAYGNYSHAQNWGTIASQRAQTAIGSFNIRDQSEVGGTWAFIIGNGTDNNTRSNALTVAWNGNTTIAGTLTQSSDRRLKEHISYLNTDAINFIQNLKPAYFKKDNQPHLGFYAQDVEEIDSWNCMTGEMNGYKTLGYTELIAPLVTYCQHLEERIRQLEEK